MPECETHDTLFAKVGLIEGTLNETLKQVTALSVKMDDVREEVAKAKGVLTVAKWVAPALGGSAGFLASWVKDIFSR